MSQPFFFSKVSFCFIHMKMSPQLCVHVDGTQFFSSWWFTAKNDINFLKSNVHSYWLSCVVLVLHSYCLYRFLDGKKTSHFKFSIPGLQGNHRNLKQQKNFNSREGFFRKFPFCTFSCINSGFGRPWDVLWIVFSSCHFSNFMTSSKVPFWQFFNFSRNGTYEPVH